MLKETDGIENNFELNEMISQIDRDINYELYTNNLDQFIFGDTQFEAGGVYLEFKPKKTETQAYFYLGDSGNDASRLEIFGIDSSNPTTQILSMALGKYRYDMTLTQKTLSHRYITKIIQTEVPKSIYKAGTIAKMNTMEETAELSRLQDLKTVEKNFDETPNIFMGLLKNPSFHHQWLQTFQMHGFQNTMPEYMQQGLIQVSFMITVMRS